MKKILTNIIVLIVLTGCTMDQIQKSEIDKTEMSQNMPNPASVYCEDHGNKLEILTAEDGSQSGICIFPDGSTCDEWAYFRGECTQATPIKPTSMIVAEATKNGSGGYMQPGISEPIEDWWGVIKSTKSGSQFDDYFERQDLESVIHFGIDSKDPKLASQIKELRDSGKIVHLYGTLFSNVMDYNGSLVQVNRIEVEE